MAAKLVKIKQCGTCIHALPSMITYSGSPKRFNCPIYDQVVRSIDGGFCPSWVQGTDKNILSDKEVV